MVRRHWGTVRMVTAPCQNVSFLSLRFPHKLPRTSPWTTEHLHRGEVCCYPCCCCSATKSFQLCDSWTAARQAPLFSTICWRLLKLMSIESVMLSHPRSPLSPFAFNLSQHQGLFWWVSSSHQVARVLGLQLQHQSFQWIFRIIWIFRGYPGRLCLDPSSVPRAPISCRQATSENTRCS